VASTRSFPRWLPPRRLIDALQRRLIYFPSPGPVPPAATVMRGGQDVVLRTDDGLELGAWFFPAGSSAVLMCNGNAGDRWVRAPLAAALVRNGVSVMLFDYRGYGGNPGQPSEDGLAADAHAARTWLASRTGRITYLGESLGAAVALRLAVEHPPSAVVLRSPFTSLTDVGRLHYPWLPVAQLLSDRYPSIERIENLSTPLLVIAGERDSIVPAELSRRLYDAAPDPKRFVLVPGADHNDPDLLDGLEVVAEIVNFVQRPKPS
jgi:fermentation-respiration switch protein FrsA (DUF1100 family)